MEADWAVALAADDPVVTVPWAATEEDGGCCFVDLRRDLSFVDKIAEAQSSAALRHALLVLNGSESALLSAKCDLWSSCGEPLDPYEMNAEPNETAFGAGSYIDLLARDPEFHASFPLQEQWLRRVTGSLRAVTARASRVDLVLRHAEVNGRPGFAVSWFVEGCGPSAAIAEQNWSHALSLSLAVIVESMLRDASERYNEHTGE
jgi:hypothetical protein